MDLKSFETVEPRTVAMGCTRQPLRLPLLGRSMPPRNAPARARRTPVGPGPPSFLHVAPPARNPPPRSSVSSPSRQLPASIKLPPALLSRATTTSFVIATGAQPDRRPTMPSSCYPPPLELQVGKPCRPESTASPMPSPHRHLAHIGEPPPSSPLPPLHRRLRHREPLPPPPPPPPSLPLFLSPWRGTAPGLARRLRSEEETVFQSLYVSIIQL
jgi:hypothetical protein